MYYDKDTLYIAQMQKGKKIYHYTTVDALINIVSKNELWVTKWDYLNDIDEFRVALDACIEVLKEENIKPEIIQDVVKSVNEDLHMNSIKIILSFLVHGIKTINYCGRIIPIIMVSI